jgi:hypothetical protein
MKNFNHLISQNLNLLAPTLRKEDPFQGSNVHHRTERECLYRHHLQQNKKCYWKLPSESFVEYVPAIQSHDPAFSPGQVRREAVKMNGQATVRIT